VKAKGGPGFLVTSLTGKKGHSQVKIDAAGHLINYVFMVDKCIKIFTSLQHTILML